MDVLIDINILILSTEDVVLIGADGATLMFEWKHIPALDRVLLEDGLLYLKSTEFKCLPFVDKDAVVFLVLTVEHLPDLHRASLEVAVG